MTSATNVAAALNDLDLFDHKLPLIDVMKKFDISKRALEILYEKPSAVLLENKSLEPNPLLKTMNEMGSSFLKRQLLQPAKFDDFEAVFLDVMNKRMTWDNLPSEVTISPTSGKPKQRVVSLLALARKIIMESTTVAIFGPALLKIDPSITDTFATFDDQSWLLLSGIPRPWANSMLAAKSKLQHSLRTYLELPVIERSGASWYVLTFEREMRARGIATQDIAGWLVMVYWV